MTDLRDAKTFEELLDKKYGKTGTPGRDEYELKSRAFMIGEMLKEARKEAVS